MSGAATPAADVPRPFQLSPAPEGELPVTVEGELPAWCRGRYLYNGPGRFRIGNVEYGHWLDGDGRVSMLTLADEPRFVHRFVRTRKWSDEETAGRALYRTFGTTFPGDQLVRGIATATPVNVSVYRWSGRLLAFGEQGLPWELDPETLETRGPFTFDGRLTEITPFTGHPKVDPETGELFGFGVSFSATHPTVTYYRFAADGSLGARRRVPLPGPYSIHDFAVSKRHAAIYVSPHHFSMDTLRDGGTVLESLDWEEDATRPESRLLLLDRETGVVRADLPIGSRYCLHLANAWERGDEVVVDVLEMDRPVYDDYLFEGHLSRVPAAQPTRLTVDLSGDPSLAVERIGSPQHGDFPSIDRRHFGRKTDVYWYLTISEIGPAPRKYYDRLVRADWSSGRLETLWTAPAGGFLAAEPQFIAHPDDPARGAVICPFHEPAREAWGFALFDAHRPGPPLARLRVPGPVHLGFHSTFLAPEPNPAPEPSDSTQR